LGAELWAVIVFAILALVAYSLWRFWRERVEYLRGIGAEPSGTHTFINPKGEIFYKSMKVEVFTGGPRGVHSLRLSIKVEGKGFFRIAKRDLFEKLLRAETYMGLSVEYEDGAWFGRISEDKVFQKTVDRLFRELGLGFLELKGDTLTAGWYIRRSPKEVQQHRLFEALELLSQVYELLRSMPSAGIYREDLRGWLTLRIPILVTIFLCLVGVAGGFYRYNPVCLMETLLTGYKLMLPIMLLYVALAILLVGGRTLNGRVVLKASFVLLVCTFFLSLFFFTYVNGRFDTSEPKVVRDKIEKKYRSPKHGYRVALHGYHRAKRWCEGFTVSEGLYMRAYQGAKVEYIIKKGFLGVEWFYQGLRLLP